MADDILLADDAWTYTGNPATVPRDFVRELIGDTDRMKKKVGDARVDLAILTHKNSYFAAAALCRQIAARFADRPNISANGVSETWSTVYQSYQELAKQLSAQGQEQAYASGGGAAPQAIAHSISALQAAADDTDRNWGPIARAGSMIDSRYDPEV